MGTLLGAGAAGVSPPATSTDEAVARFDGTTGTAIQDSVVLIDDAGNVTGVGTVDGRDLAVDGAKLDGIEALAEVNEPIASQAEAQAGVENTKTMTALRVAEAIAAQTTSLQNNLSAVVAPAVTDDSGSGYSEGSFWIDTVADESYRCVDDSVGAAVWVRTTLQTSDLDNVAVSGNSDDLTEGTTNLLLTSAERTKLGGIEAGATADQSDAEIKTAYENNADTNAFTDADETKLDGIEASADVTDEGNVIPALDGATITAATVAGTDKVLMQDVDDSDNLKTVTAQSIADLASSAVTSVNTETGAVVLDADDISDAATTNKFTTAAEITKLGGIEALADVTDEANVTSALDGATLTGVTVAGTDKVLLQDVSDADNLKTVTAQAIADLSAAPVDSVNTQTGAVVLDADDISDAATTNKFTTAAEITKLGGIEALADVTDEANVTSSLDGATLTGVTAAVDDKVLIQDLSDSDNLKTITTQSIADLAPQGDVTASSTDTFTNKTFDANGTGNSISNIDVADLSVGTDGELITWDAAGNPATVAVGTATHVLTSNGAGAAPTFQAAAAGGGKVLQVVTNEIIFPTTGSSTSSTYGTVVSATITPASTANKVLVMCNFGGFAGQAANTRLNLNIERGSTQIREMENVYSSYDATNRPMSASIQVLDSPSTASPVTYNLGYARGSASGTVYYTGDTGMSCYITLIEIEG